MRQIRRPFEVPEARDISACIMVVNAEEPLTAALVEAGDEEARMDPLTPLDTLCRIILRGREYEALTATDYDGNETPDDVDDENEGTLSVLDETLNDSVEEELIAAFEDLGEDQLAEVIAFCWVGQGTYEAADWNEAFEEAQALVSESTEEAIQELMEQPMLASVLETGLAAFDLSCDGIGETT